MAKYSSVGDMFRARINASPTLDAFYEPKGDGWETWSWSRVGEKVKLWSAGLRAIGLEDEQRVGLLCSTRVDWLIADIAISCAGGATTTIYPSSTGEDCQYILSDSGATVAVAENAAQVDKLVAQKANLPDLKVVISIDGESGHDGWVISAADLEAKGKAHTEANPDEFETIIDRITPEHLCTLIYTSGTTGRPKGVELTHDCWLYVYEALAETNLLTEKDKQYLWLPLSHSFGKMLETLAIGIGIPTAVDGRIPKIVENLAVIQPTFMAAAPRIFEKVYNKVINGAKEAGGLKYKIFRWSMGVGKEVSRAKQAGREPSGVLGIKFKIADKLVFSKLRALFGGRVRFFISGSAPLNRDIAEFFHAAGLLILEGYGLTESSAASFVNLPTSNAFGTVGPPLPGTEVKIADDGEILFRSRGVMRGYYNLPEKTAETLQDGWLVTGDIGEIDAKGHLKITDRKKDLIKTSGGKYVAPQHLEGAFKAVCSLCSQILVHGNARNYCTALITMDEEAILKWAADNGKPGKSYADLSKDADVIAYFQASIDELNKGLARYETLKKFKLLEADFTLEGGELTPSLKVKRKAIEAKYKSTLDGFYSEAFAKM